MRGWDAVVLGTTALLAALLFVFTNDPAGISLGVTGLALLAVAWVALGRRGPGHPRATALFFVFLVIASGITVAGYPTLAVIQVISYPLAWALSRTTRQAVVVNVAIALAVGAGFLVSLGVDQENLIRTALNISLSLGFSLAMGFWITRMINLGEERGRLLHDLEGAQEQIAALHRDAGAASERERLARELHDTITQDLTGLVMLAQRARRERGVDTQTLLMIEENARAVLSETRALVAAGAAVTEDGLDLFGALHRLAERFARETGVEVSVDAPDSITLSRDAEVVVLRCVQEALANARKHARASHISISIASIATADGLVHLQVWDDGVGFDPATAPDGFGLTGMADRLALVNGELEIRSSTGAGTTLTARVPRQAAAS